jgi:hypothetical protein
MGTNYYRIPKAEDLEKKHQKLVEEIKSLDLSPGSVNEYFRTPEEDGYSWDATNPWDDFVDGTKIHLGKRSGGWRFLWDFNDNQYYKNKEELFDFIRSGRVINEYGEIIDPDEFIQMALKWGFPNGLVYNQEYVDKMKKENSGYHYTPSSFDKEIDGLIVCSSSDFS